MLAAALWSAAGSAAIAVRFAVPLRAAGLMLTFGGGTPVSVVAFELTDEAFMTGGTAPVALGLTLGGLAFHAGNRRLTRWDTRHGKAARRAAAAPPRSPSASSSAASTSRSSSG